VIIGKRLVPLLLKGEMMFAWLGIQRYVLKKNSFTKDGFYFLGQEKG
jgi:hypothetical protein